MKAKRVDKYCQICGKVLHDVPVQTLYCPLCGKEKWKHTKKQETRKRSTTINDITKAAKEAGMSYGKYVAKMGL